MSASIAEVRAQLAEVSEQLRTAYRCTWDAKARLTEAIAALTELDRSHHDKLVPAELLRAEQELTRTLGLISGGADSVAALDARI